LSTFLKPFDIGKDCSLDSSPIHPFRFPKLWLTAGWLFITIIVFLSLWPKPPEVPTFEHSDKLAHLIAYSILTLWFANIYRQRSRHLLLAAAFVGLGICLELLQGLTDYRTFSYSDILANGSGVLLGIILAKTHLSSMLVQFDTWLLHLRTGRM
jgi:VanZ family protein